VLAGSAAYAIGEVLQWPTGLERKPLEARGFYAILAAATLIGLGLNFTAINPVQALFWSAVINGIVAGPVMIVVMLLASNAQVMGRFTITFWLKLFGWAATAVMIAASIGLFATWGRA
jgi:Mn2+/Fe2+ NRAMP family transporter